MSTHVEARTRGSLLSNTLASGAATVWTGLLGLVLLPFLIRELGVSEYGVWVLLGLLLVQGRGLSRSSTSGSNSRSSCASRTRPTSKKPNADSPPG